MISGPGNSRPQSGRHTNLGASPSILVLALALSVTLGLAAGAWNAHAEGSVEDTVLATAPDRTGDLPSGPAADQANGDGPPGVAAVAELTLHEGPARDVTDSFAYRLTLDQEVFAWPEGAGDGGLETGVGVIALPNLFKHENMPAQYSRIAITNVVQKPGFTDFVIPISDQNGLLDYVCEKLNEGQSEYIDLATWGYVNSGFKGSAFISVMFWEHDVFENGTFVRNLVGLTASVANWSTYAGSHPASAYASSGLPLDVNIGIPYSPWNLGRPPACGTGPGPIRRTPTPGPSPTPSATPTLTPTPTTTPTPIVPPPYAPNAPELLLPALTRRTEDAACGGTIEVQNLGADESRGVLVVWGDASGCGEACAGPLGIVCTGLIVPDGTWLLGLDAFPAGARSGALFSFTTRTLSDIGVGGGADVAVADVMCEALSAQLPGDCQAYQRFKEAYDLGLDYEGVPMDRAWGAPLGAQVQRDCSGPDADGLPVSGAYAAVSGAALGHRGLGDTHYEYALPVVHAETTGRASFAHVQNAGAECASFEIWTRAIGECAQPTQCVATDVAPGEAVMVDVASCIESAGPDAGSGSAWVASTGPLAIAVDTAAESALATYVGAPPSLRDMHGVPLLHASGAVTFAPLVYSNYLSWTTKLATQNTGAITSVLKLSVIDRAGDVLSVRQFGPVCPGGSVVIDVAAIAGVPYDFVGSARIESYPLDAAPVATPWLGPEPTSTPRHFGTPPGTPPPWFPPPTRTPGSPVPVTPGTPAPTATATATRVPLPTSTVHIDRTSIYLPRGDR